MKKTVTQNPNSVQRTMILETVSNSIFSQLKNIEYNVPEGCMLVRGVVGAVDTLNRNKRYYKREEYQRHVTDFNARAKLTNGILGEMEHPQSMNINLERVSHKTMRVWIGDDNLVYGDIMLLDTEKGKIAQAIVKSGSPLPISSRATGVVDKDGNTVLDELVTYDLVGTAGFLEAELYEIGHFEIGESRNNNSTSRMVLESFAINIDENGGVINSNRDNVKNENNMGYITLEDAQKLIAESVEQALKKSKEEEEVKESEEDNEKVTEKKKKVKESEDDETETNESEDEQISKKVDEAFLRYVDVVESWIKNDYTPKLLEGLQSWIVEEYTAKLESYMFEQLIPQNAKLTQEWLVNDYANVISEHITQDILPQNAKVLESWVKGDFSEKFASVIESFVDDKIQEVKDEIEESEEEEEVTEKKSKKKVKESEEDEKTNESETEDEVTEKKKKKVKESEEEEETNESEEDEIVKEGRIFKSTILEHMDKEIKESMSIKKPKEIKESVDKSQYKFAPIYLKYIPESFKPKYEALTESQKEKVNARASLRIFETQSDVALFWKTLNFESLIEGKTPSNPYTRNVNESVEGKSNLDPFQASIVEGMKFYK